MVDQLSIHYKPSQLRKWLEIRHGIQLTAQQTKFAKRYGSLSISTSGNGSPAMKLLQKLDEDPNIKWIAQ